MIKKQLNGGEREFREIRKFKMLGRESSVLRKAFLERMKKEKKSYVFLNNSYLGYLLHQGRKN